jgi:hypothetical protein
MKTVFSNSHDVVHAFAQRNQPNGKSSNIFFYENKIYSYGYHYLLGEFIDEKTILINDEGYSVTTAKHISYLIGGTRQYKQFFTMSCDIYHVHSRVLSLKDKLATARKPFNYINQILSLWESLNEFINYTNNKNIFKDVRYKEIKSIVKYIQSKPEDYQKKLSDEKKKKEISDKRKEEKRIKDTLSKWYKYEIDSFRIGDKDFIRLSKDELNVETSQNVKVCVDDARTLYQLICKGIDIKGYKIGNYVINSINGTLKVGCHNIDIESVHKVGKQIK